MSNSLLIAVVAGLGSMVGWGSADFFAKKTIDVIGDIKTLFWAQLIGVIPLACIFLAHPQAPHLNRYDPIFLILFGIVSALSYLPLYRGFGKGEVSLLSPVFASYSVILVILSALFLGEAISPSRLVAILIVFAGILLISSNPAELRSHFKSKTLQLNGMAEVLFAMFVYSFWLFFLDKFLHDKSWVFPLLIIRLVAVLTLLGYAWLRDLRLNVTNKSLWKFLTFIGIFDVAAFAFVSYGFSQSTYTSVIAVLSATFSVPTIILAAIFLKERIKLYQAFAILMILSGITLVVLNV